MSSIMKMCVSYLEIKTEVYLNCCLFMRNELTLISLNRFALIGTSKTNYRQVSFLLLLDSA